MSETGLLVLVSRYPHQAALARRAGAMLFPELERLRREGLVTGRGGRYRLTRRGRSELELRRALGRAIARAF